MNNNLKGMLAELKVPEEFVGDFCKTLSPLNSDLQCYVAERTLDLKRKSKVPARFIDEVYQEVFLTLQGVAGYMFFMGEQGNKYSDDYQCGYRDGYDEHRQEMEEKDW